MNRAERNRQAVLERDRERKREYADNYSHLIAPQLPPKVVLQDWHTDEHGCLARTVGAE